MKRSPRHFMLLSFAYKPSGGVFLMKLYSFIRK